MSAQVTGAPRAIAVDVARGLAVVGVIFNHALIGLYLADILSLDSPLTTANGALYLFRMASLAVLLGLFIPGGIAKRGTSGYLRHRLPLLLWLYLVWQIGQGIIQVGATGVRNGETGWWDVVAIWLPLAHLWFLPFLATVTVALVLLRPWERTTRGRLALAGTVLLTVLIWGWVPDYAGIHGLALIGFVAVGSTIGLPRMRALLEGSATIWAMVGVVSLGLLVAVLHLPVEAGTIDNGGADLVVQLTSVAGAAFGVVLLLAVSALLARVPHLNRLLAYLGRHTLEIYLAHILVVATLRVVLQKGAGVENLTVHLVLAVLLGVAVPLLAARLAPRMHLGWVFDAPRWLRERTAGPPPAPRPVPAPRSAPAVGEGPEGEPSPRT